MKRELFLAILLTGVSHADEPLVLSTKALDNVTIGMSVDSLQLAVHSKLPYNQYANHGCGIVTTPALEPYGISFMIENKILTRINVDFYGTDPRPLTIKTPAGINLESTETDIKKAYAGKMRVEANSGDPSWHTIYVDDPDQKHALVFETNGEKVKSMRAGAYPGVSYADGCAGEQP